MKIKTLPNILNSLFLLLSLHTLTLPAQTDFRVMSYNVENLFDCENDPSKDDEEYLPNGSRHWTKGRYYHKLQQIAKVIIAAGQWSTPALIGLCEVENDSTLTHLLSKTPLRTQHYRYVMTNSPDKRGIDVALLYQRNKFAYIGHHCHRINFKHNQDKQSRDLLHVWGRVQTGDTLDVFVCHFPSRSGGEKTSEPDRIEASERLKEETTNITRTRKTPNILIMGDFNDEPSDISIRKTLNTKHPGTGHEPELLYNMFAPPVSLSQKGSHKFQGEWGQLDQFIVSGNLLNPQHKLHVFPGSVTIFSPRFLLTNDKTHRGVRPLRTFYGFKYEGGYSDHLPILIDFSLSLPTE